MSSCERRRRRTTAKSLIVLAVAAPLVCFAQPNLESGADRQRELVERIEQEEARNGPRSEALIGPLTGLALLFQESGDRVLATATIERVLQVIRANYGLYSLQQAPLIQQLIANEEAIGDIEAAWELEQEVLTLARRHPEDLRTVPILRKFAQKRLALLERYKSGDYRPEEIILRCYYDGYSWYYPEQRDYNACERSGSSGVVTSSILSEATRHYLEAIRVILRQELYSSEDLRELEMAAIRANYLHTGRFAKDLHFCGNDLPILETDGVGDGNCLGPFQRLLLYEVRSSAPALTQITALIDGADAAFLSLGRPNRTAALSSYEQAHELLKQSGVAQASIDELFAPEIPVVLPAFLPNPLVSEGTQDSTGFIDVAFDVIKDGTSDNIGVLDTTTNASRAAERDLVRLIRNSTFRPRVKDDQLADVARVTIRYHLKD